MDYDFRRLSTRSFEQLVQSLALATLGPGVNVFGDGPDGGREATFDGKVPFPTADAPWEGYGVIQAKFRQRAGLPDDGRWAVNELNKELDRLSAKGKKFKRPKYYIFATNVVLTPVGRTGTKDKATGLLDKYKRRLGIADYRVWDYDQLCALLDQHESIRTANLAWITAGDVLAKVIEQSNISRPDFKEVMLNYVQKELQTDQYVNLGQAGYTRKENTPLARVFIDLPVGDAKALHTHESPVPLVRQWAVSELSALSSLRLDPPSLAALRESEAHSSEPLTTGRIVFVGGPGQGKSTISQFSCQLHRLALLETFASKPLLPEIAEAINIIREQAEAEGIPIPSMPRFPLRVVLNAFASALAEGRCNSLFDYIVKRIADRTERIINSDDLRRWLRAYPVLLVLDGLDEVPPSSNREQVLQAVNDFVVDAHEALADLLLVATTRPQGYNDEFSPRYFSHFNLLPLAKREALHYAERLLRQRWGVDADRISILRARMERASAEESTARLMRSPLQVTILTLLVESIGQPPRERWKLFGDYYRVISRRERERDIPAARLLTDYEPDIDIIHQEVGAALQARSELSGSTDSTISEIEFSRLVDARLTREGHTGDRKDLLRAEIIEATLQRLVFLVSPQQDRIGFEIRSLQEFMAAEFLMQGTDEQVVERLEVIAPAPHWRNVFLFAAGRCFHERQRLRDNLLALVMRLNEREDGSKRVAAAVLLGSELALEILEDGALLNQPAQLATFSRVALRLLELPPCDSHFRLAKQFRPELQQSFEIELSRHLALPALSNLGAWRVVIYLAEAGHDWALRLAKRYWPSSSCEVLSVFSFAESYEHPWLAARWVEAATGASPSDIADRFPAVWNGDGIPRLAPVWLRDVLKGLGPSDDRVGLRGVSPAFGMGVHLLREDDEPEHRYELQDDVPSFWRWLIRANDFARHPSADLLEELVVELRDIADQEGIELPLSTVDLPWPVEAIARSATSIDDLDRIAIALNQGEMGDAADWLAAQRRWLTDDITLEDLRSQPPEPLPFDRSISTRGVCLGALSAFASHRDDLSDAASELYSLWRLLPSGLRTHSQVASDLIFLAGVCSGVGQPLPTALIASLPELVAYRAARWFDLDLVARLPADWWSSGDAPLTLASAAAAGHVNCTLATDGWGLRLEELALGSSSNDGVMRCLAAACVAGYRPTRFCAETLVLDGNCVADAAKVLVAIAAGALEGELRAQELVDIVVKNRFAYRHVEDAVRVAQSAGGTYLEFFLLGLYDSLPADYVQARVKVLAALQESQSRATGGGFVGIRLDAGGPQ